MLRQYILDGYVDIVTAKKDHDRKGVSCSEKVKQLRAMTGMNRKEFCAAFHIPYQTVTDWELDKRTAPAYVLRLLEYYIRVEKAAAARH